jgi:integrase
MDEIRLHDFRHYMTTTLLAAGVDPKTVAQRGGWSKADAIGDILSRRIEAS